jgi:hypothetical protein
MKKMKKNVFVAGVTLAMLVMGFASCEKADDPGSMDIEGEYIGSFSISNSLKSAQAFGVENDHGTTVVSKVGDKQIEVHCFGNQIDTTFMLDYYEHNDSVMVCLTGLDFVHHYGHMLGQGHMGGGMMDDIQNGETQWMHHLSDEHRSGDEHFGGFDMQEGSFTYSFKMMDGSQPYYLKFHGVKQ